MRTIDASSDSAPSHLDTNEIFPHPIRIVVAALCKCDGPYYNSTPQVRWPEKA